MKVLVTGAAGFIGSHLSRALCESGYEVVGIDNLNDYYDVNLKIDRLKNITPHELFKFSTVDICDKDGLDTLFSNENFDIVFNLAAQAGVRHSIDKPYKYINSNLIGFINILEACRNFQIKHLFFASSSSVYGDNKKVPFSVDDVTDSPVSLYAATKKSNELMAYSYSHLYHIPVTGLRFFTVYGPWGRPDMAYYNFTKNVIDSKPINLFNYGKMKRDFTYIDDIVSAILALVIRLKSNDFKWKSSGPEFKVFNIGNNKPVELMRFVTILENLLEMKANVNLFPMQSGDVVETYADIESLKLETGFVPTIEIEAGLSKFVDWYRAYYKK